MLSFISLHKYREEGNAGNVGGLGTRVPNRIAEKNTKPSGRDARRLFHISVFPEPWSAVIGENGGDFKHNRPRLSPQNGSLETYSLFPEASKNARVTGYRRF